MDELICKGCDKNILDTKVKGAGYGYWVHHNPDGSKDRVCIVCMIDRILGMNKVIQEHMECDDRGDCKEEKKRKNIH